jgi:hypothetical protein
MLRFRTWRRNSWPNRSKAGTVNLEQFCTNLITRENDFPASRTFYVNPNVIEQLCDPVVHVFSGRVPLTAAAFNR